MAHEGGAMRRLWILLTAAIVVVGCERDVSTTAEGDPSMILTVSWQRLVTEDGQTCDRCGGTQEELRKAIGALRESLHPLGIEVATVEEALSTEECAADIIKSNRILIEGRPLEEWLGGEVGQSPCGSCCATIGEEVDCRTVNVDGTTYEVIPAQLIVRAGLLAASQLMRAPSPSPCCPGSAEPCETNAPCCPGLESDESATS